MISKKEDLICALRMLVDAIEKSKDIDKFTFNVNNETVEVPTEYWKESELTWWIDVDFNVRFLKG